MAEIIVRDVQIVEQARNAGKVDLARFTAELPGVLLSGCRLQITTHGDVASYPSNRSRPDTGREGAFVTNPEWRREMTRQALALYHSAGGKLAHGLPIYPSTPSAQAR